MQRPHISPILRRAAAISGMAMLVMLGNVSAASARGDALIEGGKLCTQQFPVQEQNQRIPTHLLAAISTTESGRWHKQLGMAVPWPWTINVEGKGYYFDSKAEAIANTQRFIAQGKRSIDVGCMQVNLKHHAKAFSDLNQAFDPAANVAYAAKFLRTNYNELGDWIKATAAYHSRTEARGKIYLAQIERSWNRIVAKVAEARANQPGGMAVRTQQAPASREIKVASAAPEMALDRQKLRPLATARNVKNISVRDRKSGVLVVHGAGAGADIAAVATAAPVAPAAPAATVAAAPEIQQTIIRPAANTVRRVALDNPATATQPSVTETPARSVFVN